MGEFVYHTPLLTSRLLSERTGFDVRLKAEMFQRGGSYKIRGPMNKFAQLTDEEKRRGVICSSAGNHAQGVALAAARLRHQGRRRAWRRTPRRRRSRRRARTAPKSCFTERSGTKPTRRRSSSSRRRGYTYIHPFDDEQLIVGQGTVGLEIYQDWPEVELADRADRRRRPDLRRRDRAEGVQPGDQDRRRRVIRRAGDDAQRARRASASRSTRVDCIIDGLRVKRVGEKTYEIVRRHVDDLVTLPDEQIFEAVVWIMSHAEGRPRGGGRGAGRRAAAAA